jgi:CRISPR-associated protein Cmr3
MIGLFIEPTDVWLFGDGRPFDQGYNQRAESLFPPYPTVIQGAIRSYYLTLQKGLNWDDPQQIKQLVGDATDYKNLRLRGPYLAKKSGIGNIDLYFPLPASSIIVDNEHHHIEPCDAPTLMTEGVYGSSFTPKLLIEKQPHSKGETNLWVSKEQLETLHSKENTTVGKPASCFYRYESRLGIEIESRSRTTKEGALFEVNYIRLTSDSGLYLEMDGYEGWPNTGLLKLGGENRGATFEQVPLLTWPEKQEMLPERFLLYFCSPTYFNNGWQPETWSKFFEGEVRLASAAISHYETIGGYDLAKKEHKNSRRYVPAGSVYYFEGHQARLRCDLIQNAITDYGAEIGFGQYIQKEW